jgi:hypothetical protein
VLRFAVFAATLACVVLGCGGREGGSLSGDSGSSGAVSSSGEGVSGSSAGATGTNDGAPVDGGGSEVCASDSDCALGLVCIASRCRSQCVVDADCLGGT